MPHHLRDITRKCKCGRAATVELYNDRNAPIGAYCKSCGAAALRRVQQEEKRIAHGNPWPKKST